MEYVKQTSELRTTIPKTAYGHPAGTGFAKESIIVIAFPLQLSQCTCPQTSHLKIGQDVVQQCSKQQFLSKEVYSPKERTRSHS